MLALASVGGGYETVREATDARAYPMPGQLIDVGGHRLHLNCTGSGSPTVVLEPGAGGMSSDLGWITPAVARDTRVCVYDRAGRGWSEPADTPQDATQIATDLHTLLHRATRSRTVRAGGPLLRRPLRAHFRRPLPRRGRRNGAGGLHRTGVGGEADGNTPATGLLRPPGPCLRPGLDLGATRLGRLTEVARRRRRESPPLPRARSTIDEYAMANSSGQQAASLRDFADKPLVVLTAGVGPCRRLVGGAGRLATLSTNSAHRVIAGADHIAMIADEEDAAATTRAILDVVSSIRSPGRWSLIRNATARASPVTRAGHQRSRRQALPQQISTYRDAGDA